MNHSPWGNPRDYGFRWGPMDVIRAFEYRNRRLLYINTDGGRKLEVIVSPRGNRITVTLDGKRLVAEEGA